jgi:tetratricopeptide (TPR) repeat protein
MLGEWEKGIQYGTAPALRDAPADPTLYANLGTLYFRKGQYNQAAEYLELAVRGGTNEDGVAVEGIPLSYDLTTIETYSRYGLALANINSCNQAVTVANTLLGTVADNENAVYNANEILKICEQNLLNPPTATPAPTPTIVTGPTATPQP